MQEKSRPNIPKDINLKTSTSNLFLNIIIIVLGIVIFFLIYSLVVKFRNNSGNNADIENRQASSAIVQLEVLNGCGVGGVAEKFTDFLRQKNFDVVQTGNYISFEIEKSMVIDRTGNKANAFKVAEALGIDRSNVIQHLNNDYFLDVSLVIGKDYNQLKLTK